MRLQTPPSNCDVQQVRVRRHAPVPEVIGLGQLSRASEQVPAMGDGSAEIQRTVTENNVPLNRELPAATTCTSGRGLAVFKGTWRVVKAVLAFLLIFLCTFFGWALWTDTHRPVFHSVLDPAYQQEHQWQPDIFGDGKFNGEGQ